MKSALFLLGVWLTTAAVIAQAPAQTSARDQSRATFVGSAVITGTVVADDDTRMPLRNVLVGLTRTNIEDIRYASTDEAGRFRFDALPAGNYKLSAAKGAYIAIGYGAPKAGAPGAAITLKEGQIFDAMPMALMRGAAIAGRLLSRNGQPVSGARVQASQFVVVNGERRPRSATGSSGTATTNAHGEYRIFGLLPGEYLVSVADSGFVAQNDVSAAELAWARQQAGPAPAFGRPSTLAPTLFPGTPDAAAAVPITLARAEERLGVDFPLQSVPVSRIAGVVTEVDGRPATNVRVWMVSALAGWWSIPIRTAQSDSAGAFVFAGVPPGQYRVSVQGGRVATQYSPTTPARVVFMFWAGADLTLSGQDVSDLTIRMQPGQTITGQVTFRGAAATARPDLSRIALRLAPATRTPPPETIPPAIVAADGTFKFEGVTPGSYRLTGTAPNSVGAAPIWRPSSAMSGGVDVIDVPLVVGAGQNPSGLVVTFTDAPTEVSGNLIDAGGKPVPQIYVLVFSADRADWTPDSRRVASVLSGDGGAYSIAGLPPGDYYLCGLTEIDTDLKFDSIYLEQLVPSAIKLTLAEGEKRRQDLQIAR
jgi:protocatechuate 3,4-dioxygenase beta subunit